MAYQDGSQDLSQEEEESQMLGGPGGSRGFKGRTRRRSAYLPILQIILLVLQLGVWRNYHVSRMSKCIIQAFSSVTWNL
jgi:hypothetical protein